MDQETALVHGGRCSVGGTYLACIYPIVDRLVEKLMSLFDLVDSPVFDIAVVQFQLLFSPLRLSDVFFTYHASILVGMLPAMSFYLPVCNELVMMMSYDNEYS